MPSQCPGTKSALLITILELMILGQESAGEIYSDSRPDLPSTYKCVKTTVTF